MFEKFTKRQIWSGIGAAALLCLLIVFWCVWLGRTRIAFVNFQPMSLQEFAQANDNAFIRIGDVAAEDVEKLGRYDMVFINGMGLSITEDQRAVIRKFAVRGKPVYTTMATNPANNISTLTAGEKAFVQSCLSYGGRRNCQSLLNFVRRNIDGKIGFCCAVEEPSEKPSHFLWYPSDSEEIEFQTVADYDKFLKDRGLYVEDGPNIIVSGQITDPSDLVLALVKEKRYNVYPVSSMTRLLEYAEQIHPAAVINLAHGRLGDDMVDYLKRNDALLFDPLTINGQKEEWEDDPMGMMGGFLSQSVVMPEIDGAIRTSALFAQRKDRNGLIEPYAMPDRLETFVQTVGRYIDLRTKANSQKRVAIVYFKGPGQSALVASGLEVLPSLYNFLKAMRSEGYNLDGLPATVGEFEKQVMRYGSLFNPFASGDAEKFMESGNPQLVTAGEYAEWTGKSIDESKAKAVDEVFGQFPGNHNLLKTEDGRLAFPRLQYGNVVLLPQPMAGEGKDEFSIVHGTDQVPPHSYIAPYLWIQHGFKADALIHFGAHGSLEFTPQKQVALSSLDWPDRLVGALPHFYLYTVDNVGEAMTAKRRSYAGIVSYLTPPFHESNLRGTYSRLEKKLHEYNGENADKAGLASEIRKLAAGLGIDKDLNINDKDVLSEEDIARIETYADELASEKVTGTPYILGVPYSGDDIRTSVFAMTTDPLAYSRYNIDRLLGRADPSVAMGGMAFDDRYVKPAKALVERLYNGGEVSDGLICSVAGISMEQLEESREIIRRKNAPKGMLAMMMAMAKKDMAADSTAAAMPGQGAAGSGHPDVPSMGGGHHGMTSGKLSGDGHPSGGNLSDGAMGDGRPGMSSMDSGHLGMTSGANGAEVTIPEAHNSPIAKIMRHRMRKMLATGDSSEMLEMAKSLGVSPEALAKMKTAMSGNGGDPHQMGTGDGYPSSGHPGMPSGAAEHHPDGTASMGSVGGGEEYSRSKTELAMAVDQIETALRNVGNYRRLLAESPALEVRALLSALDGGYTAPSPGGDPVANPNILPTGRNLFAINAEETPTEDAWERGMRLAKNTLEEYRKRHDGEYPRKVSYTLWSGEFIQTGGATIAQVLYMLGVEPVRDRFGRVSDIRLIPAEELGRPRIDVVVQTSGQLRDLAASRLFLISRAVRMAAEADDGKEQNMVKEGVAESERYLIDRGVSPKAARELSGHRVFGGVNGGYGSGIQGMVEAGDRWADESQIAAQYIRNMGAYYGDKDGWQSYADEAFAAALTRTDAVVQPRQSNTWGALSLDHVYEFMGGMNLAVRNVTGKDPDAYFSDYRNRNRWRMQDSKEAIAVEARTKLLNEDYVREAMAGGASSASGLAEMVRNAYGWNVMKPESIDSQLWDEMYSVYVEDKYSLGVQEQMGQANPAAFQEMTATMMETARKGYWKATPQQLAGIARVHTEMVGKYGASGSSFEGGNAALQSFIADNAGAEGSRTYRQGMANMTQTSADRNAKGMLMEKQSSSVGGEADGGGSSAAGIIAAVIVCAVFIVMIVAVRKRKK